MWSWVFLCLETVINVQCHYLLQVYSDFIFLLKSVLVFFVYLPICSFHLGVLVCKCPQHSLKVVFISVWLVAMVKFSLLILIICFFFLGHSPYRYVNFVNLLKEPTFSPPQLIFYSLFCLSPLCIISFIPLALIFVCFSCFVFKV